jgi:uncharacterized protein YjbI with pentapeptide repeats
MHPNLNRPSRALQIAAVLLPLVAFVGAARADIFQWEYINPADPSQGKRQSTTLAPHGAGVNAVPGANLSVRNLTMAYLVGANLSPADLSIFCGQSCLLRSNLSGTNLTDADLTNANFAAAILTDVDITDAVIRGANFGAHFATTSELCGFYGCAAATGTGITLDQLYSTASYQAHDLTGIGLSGNDLTGGNFARQNLTNADFAGQNLTNANFGGANLTGAKFRKANLANANFSVIGCVIECEQQYATLTGADLTTADARGAYGFDLSDLSGATTANLIWPDGHVSGLDLDAGGLLVVRDYDGGSSYGIAWPPIPITVDQHLTMGPGGTLRMVFEADAWDSTISFAPGIPVTLGGTLELKFAADVDIASQIGRTFDLFDWTGVTPTGTFAIDSPYAWDLSNLYTTGEATLTAVPEPTSLATLAVATLFVLLCRPLHPRKFHGVASSGKPLLCGRSRLMPKVARGISKALAPLMIPFICLMPAPAQAETYNWLPWTFATSQSASASVPGRGSVEVSVQAPSTSLIPFTVQFDNVSFSPTVASSVGAGSAQFQTWAFQIDLTSLFDTSGLVVGLGNFGHGTSSLPGYRLRAVDQFGAAIPLGDLTQIGSYDHTWISPSWPFPFNDDVSLNVATGLFDVTTIPGGDDYNSDILLLALPPSTGHLTVETITPSAGETINVLVAIPEPSGLILLIIALAAILAMRCGNLRRPSRALQIAAALFPLVAFAAAARADIFQWEYIDPANPSQGKRQSTTLAPDGAGVDAVPGAYLSNRDLHMAHLNGANLSPVYSCMQRGCLLQRASNLSGTILTDADLTNANFYAATLTDADFTDAEVRGATFRKDDSTGTGITPVQLYSTASYQAHDLSGISFERNDLTGGNFADQKLVSTSFSYATLTSADFRRANLAEATFAYASLPGANFQNANLTNANFAVAWLEDADFTGAEIRGAIFSKIDSHYTGTGITLTQLYSSASYQAYDLSGINLFFNNLAGGNFARQNLTNAVFRGATLTDADFTGAVVRGTNFTRYVHRYDNNYRFIGGIAPGQLYSTASYQAHDLSGISVERNELAGANFAGQNLTNANFSSAVLTSADFSGATLTDADFTGADVRGARFGAYYDDNANSYVGGLTLAQLHSTASYQVRDLSGISLAGNDLSGANFAGQNLTDADFSYATLLGADFREAKLTDVTFNAANLTGVNFSGQNLTNADFGAATLTDADFTGAEVRGATFANATDRGFTAAQLYSTASYKAHNLTAIGLGVNDLSGWNFAGQNLTKANFGGATLTNADLSQANLTNAGLVANLTGANFREANLTNALFFAVDPPGCAIFIEFCSFHYATLSDADLTAADARGAFGLNLWEATTANLIRPDGHIDGLDLNGGGLLVVRDYDGDSRPAIPITVDEHLAMGPGGTLRVVFEADAWDSTISFAPGIPVALGGTLELTFAADMDIASQIGRTFDLFDWTGVTPTGVFALSSPYAWDLSTLYTTGEATLTVIPEPSTLALVALAGIAIAACCRRRRS